MALSVGMKAAAVLIFTGVVAPLVGLGLKRLTGGGRGGMGSMFKVMAISEPHLTELAGFREHEAAADKAALP